VTTLILCVDRDDDLGRKTKINSPVIGREAILEAAIALGLADPEEPDTNTLLTAVKTYDELLRVGKDVEVAVICGSAEVGLNSDQILASQLDELLARILPKETIFISDGAEDEYILPIITSRLKVASVKKVLIKQAQNIESTYYFIAKALKDEKIRRKFVIPLGLSLLIISLSGILGHLTVGVGVVAITVSLYLLISAFNLEPVLARVAHDFKEGLMTGRVHLLFFWVFPGVFVLIGLVHTYKEYIGKPLVIQNVFSAFTTIIWWVIVAIIFGIVGKVVDKYIRERKILWSYWIVPFSLITFGLVILIANDIVSSIDKGLESLVSPPLFWYLVARLFSAIVVGSVGIITYKYIRKQVAREEEEPAVWQY
jgi:putative membrane protein